MKTQELIELLARDAGPAPKAMALRRLLLVAGAGVAVSSLMASTLYGAIPSAMYGTLAPWIKLGYAAAMAWAAAWLTAWQARPAAHLSLPQQAVAAVFAVMWDLGLAALFATSPGGRINALLGPTWSNCLWGVLILSMPALGGTLWALRGLAPTRPRAAGFAAGLFAGSLGAFGYALSCPEVSPAFVALWYSLGIGLVGAIGAALGPRLLRW